MILSDHGLDKTINLIGEEHLYCCSGASSFYQTNATLLLE